MLPGWCNMILFILLACMIAKINKYRVAPVFKDASLYPFFAVECVYWVFQGFAFSGNYMFLPYSGYLQSAYTVSMLFPILRHRLYARAIAGAGMVITGTVLNRLVISANGGRMPVLPTLSKLTGYFNPGALMEGLDAVHMRMGADTALNFLGDTIDVGFSIMSPGDLLIHGFTAVIVYGVMKTLNKSSSEGD
jgi:hypothetical protein